MWIDPWTRRSPPPDAPCAPEIRWARSSAWPCATTRRRWRCAGSRWPSSAISGARACGPRETVERARCLTAEAEVALAARDLAWPSRALAEALRTFTAHGDRENATHARLLQIRRLLLLGRVDEADGACAVLAVAAA